MARQNTQKYCQNTGPLNKCGTDSANAHQLYDAILFDS